MLRLIAAVAFSVLSHFRGAWIALAVVPFPGSLNAGSIPASAGTPNAVSAQDGLLTAVALTVEIALFVLVPIYLRARRRARIRSAIHISYDSRRMPAEAYLTVMPATPATHGSEMSNKGTRLRLAAPCRN